MSIVWPASILLLWVPGALLSRILGLKRRPDRITRIALELSLGLAFWPILLLWTSTLGLRWSPSGARLLFIALLGATAVIAVVARRREPPVSLSHSLSGGRAIQGALFILVALLAVSTRAFQIEGVILPPWVDSVHHEMVVRLIVEGGAVPVSYAPFIPGSAAAAYHWGFHAPVAWLAWLLGRTDPFEIAGLLLHYGQVLNALSVFALYTAGRELFASRRAGLLSALL